MSEPLPTCVGQHHHAPVLFVPLNPARRLNHVLHRLRIPVLLIPRQPRFNQLSLWTPQRDLANHHKPAAFALEIPPRTETRTTQDNRRLGFYKPLELDLCRLTFRVVRITNHVLRKPGMLFQVRLIFVACREDNNAVLELSLHEPINMLDPQPQISRTCFTSNSYCFTISPDRGAKVDSAFGSLEDTRPLPEFILLLFN